MAWIAVWENGAGFLYREKPVRDKELEGYRPASDQDLLAYADKHVIKAIVGRELTWKDEPVEVGVLTKKEE